MTPNKSLEISVRMQDMLKRDLLQFIEPIFPWDAIGQYESKSEVQRRDRVFNSENTLLTMVVTALQEDKSLTASVHLFQSIFEQNRKKLIEEISTPDTKKSRIQKSKTKEMSLNTAAYSKARDRIEQGLIDGVFQAIPASNTQLYSKWHGYTVFNTDGTYVQLQDSPGIPSKYRSQQQSEAKEHGYPQALLQIITQQGSGFVHSYTLGSRSDSELQLIVPLLDRLPAQSLLLADDLYNCYWLMAILIQRGINFIVPDKKDRLFKIVRKIAEGDTIVEITKPRSKSIQSKNAPDKIVLRRIEYRDSMNPNMMHVVLTSLLDESITKEEIVSKYSGRWDVEITIREVKVLMSFAILRGKTEAMIFKEIGVALTAYNLVRKVIADSVVKTDFSPETDFIQKFIEAHKAPLVDCKGRIYSRWAPGRPPANTITDKVA